MATIFKLIIEDDEGKTTVYPLAETEVAIGRRDGNTIRLMERNVSRRHAKLSRTNGTVFIEDLDSYNGIRINGERITGKYEVKEGDLVEIGDYHLALQRTEVAEETPAPSQSNQDGQWPQAGTVPDFRLPEEILQDVQHGPRDTLHDEPMPQMFGAPTVDSPGAKPADPMVRPPPRGEDTHSRDLPPFPQPGAPFAAQGGAPFGAPAGGAPFGPSGGQPLARVPLSKPGDSETPTERPADKPLAMGPARTSSVPRLVCVSTSYAGKEFALTRPELIIGRVEDNDIVIEHRSVSRNHAKILSNEGTHKIIDLQSANGILVNGEEYAMTDLRKGDLIELGHVRFRFTPANEPFVPTDEEADEMRAAGVEPPSRDKKPAAAPQPSLEAPAMAHGSSEPAMASYDPSQAATVTDTPLDALQMGHAFSPQLAKPSHGSGSNGVATEVKSDPPPKRAAADQRPTELNHATRQPSPLSAPAAMPKPRRTSQEPETRQERIDETPPAPPKSKTPLLILMGFLVLVIVVLAVVLLRPSGTDGPDPSRMDQLAQLVREDDSQGVVDFYEKHRDELQNNEIAKALYDAAVEKLKNEEPEDPSPDLEDPSPIPAPPPDEVEDPTPTAPPNNLRTKKRVRVPKKPKPTATDKAKEAFERGRTALLKGKLTEAKTALEACIEIDATYAECHRNLGVLYAKQDDTVRAVKHYRRYIELAPNAKDADRVRAMLKDVEAP